MKLTLQDTISVSLRSEASTTSTKLEDVHSSHIINGIGKVGGANGEEWWHVEVLSASNDPSPRKGYILAKFLKEKTDDEPLLQVDKKLFIDSLSFAAKSYGVDRDYLAVVAQIESGMQNIRATDGSAAIGPFQFTPAIWAELLGSMEDKDLTTESIVSYSNQALVAAYHSARNITAFEEKRQGLPTRIERYLTGAFGMEMADVILKARDVDAKKKLSELSLPAIKNYLPAKQATAIINKKDSTVEELLTNIDTQILQAAQAIWSELYPNGTSSPINSGEPPWLTVAYQELKSGVTEIAGTGSNPRIGEYHDEAGGQRKTDADGEAWCASFISFCMAQSGNSIVVEKNLKSKKAADWRNWGEPIDSPPPLGALCVLVPLAKNNSGHVGFFIKMDSTHITMLGGNQGNPDAVCEQKFLIDKLVCFRWLNWSQSPTTTNPNPSPFVQGESFEQKAPKVMRLLIADFSLTAIQAAGILGNIGHECTGFKDMREIGQPDGKGGYGWCQWTGHRHKTFFKWCENNQFAGKDDWKKDDASYGYLKYELKETSEKEAIPALQKTTGLEEAVKAFQEKFERAKVGVEHYEKRNDYANKALSAFKNSKV
ncbi:MAG: phage tail tip lysozyme [Methylococcales bacterium]|nr:phage tail tip lysozyme [Methylococcales bacterium]